VDVGRADGAGQTPERHLIVVPVTVAVKVPEPRAPLGVGIARLTVRNAVSIVVFVERLSHRRGQGRGISQDREQRNRHVCPSLPLPLLRSRSRADPPASSDGPFGKSRQVVFATGRLASFSIASRAGPGIVGVVEAPIGILFEHPLWFRPLFAELERRGVAYERLHALKLTFDPGAQAPYSVVLNRMSPSAWTRGPGQAIFHSLHFLAYLEEVGAEVINGRAAFQVEISKARQCALFARLGVRYPAARAIGDRGQLVAAAQGLRFPVLVKPNVGGSGAGIRSFATAAELREAAEEETFELGLDGTALVQEHLPAADGSVVRIEILGGEFLYAIRLRLLPGSFNLCPADYCELPGIADGVSGRACRSSATTRRARWSRTRSGSWPGPGWSSAGSSTS